MLVWRILVCVAVCCALRALDISTTFGKEDGEDFSVLTLRNDVAFPCKEVLDAYGKALSIECNITSVPDRGFPGLDNSFFRLTYKIIDGAFWLYIYPKYQQKLFAIPKDPKSNFSIDKQRVGVSHLWQIVGYKKAIPFLSSHNAQGLDFPVKILGEQTPIIPELNTDNRPIQATQNQDFRSYTQVQEAMKKGDYIGALESINDALMQNPNSVFRRDLTYDRVIAISKLNRPSQDLLIESATTWLRTFASDPDVPEILYILADAYKKENLANEAEYAYKRIKEGYPTSRFAPLAEMQLANATKAIAPIHARIQFQSAYEGAKDLPSASEIAIEWAIFELSQEQPAVSKDLINKVLSNYPQFFLENESERAKLLDVLTRIEDYKTLADITNYLATHISDTDEKERQIFMLGDYYQQAHDIDNAHRANQQYLEQFADDYPNRAQIVQERDDRILFDVAGDDDEKLKRYAYIMEKYPNSEEYAKAKDLRAQILLGQKHYDDVLALYNEGDSPYRQQALDALLQQAIAQKNCPLALQYLVQTSTYNITPAEKLFAVDCASSAGLLAVVKQLTNGMVEASTSLSDRLEWLYRVAQNLFALGEYKDASLAARDAFNLAKQEKRHYDIVFTLFAIFKAINAVDEAKKLLPFIQTHFANDERVLPVYATLLDYAIDEKDATSIQIYAQNIIDLQATMKSDEFTPYAEFALANVLRDKKQYQQALSVLLPLESATLTQEESAQMLYRIASLYDVSNNATLASEYFTRCASSAGENEWKTLCNQAQKILQNRTPNMQQPQTQNTQAPNEPAATSQEQTSAE